MSLSFDRILSSIGITWRPSSGSAGTTTKPTTGFAKNDAYVGNNPAGELGALLAGDVGRGEEARILSLLRTASTADLNRMLGAVDTHALLDEVEDHWFFGPNNRQALYQILFEQRIGEISIPNRAALVHGLQVHATTATEERAALRIFQATYGADLTALKNAIDASPDHRDLAALVYQDIDDEGIRQAMLQHIATQAQGLPRTEVKVFSDIDDTFYANYRDQRYPKQTPYPGVRQFYQELDRGGSETGRLGDLVFLTARPDDEAGIIEEATRASLRTYGVSAVVLGGDLLSNLSNEAIAQKKVENFTAFSRLYPEYNSVFIGDSGQGDALAGDQMLRQPGTPTRAVFIHNVTGMSAADKAAWAQRGTFVFDNYVEAATEAFRRGLISRSGLLRVVSTANNELRTMNWPQRAARQAELDAAAVRANQAAGIAVA